MIEHMAGARGERSEDPLVLAPPVALSGGPLGAVQAADRKIARLTAVRARAVAQFAASRTASADRAQGEPGAMSPERWAARPELLRPVSEWAAQELSVALSITTSAAETLIEQSLILVRRLPGTLAAMEAGALHVGHLWAMREKVAPIADDAVRAEVEEELLRWAGGRVTTPAQLTAKARREVLRRNAGAAVRQLEAAVRRRGVSWCPDRVDGMGTVAALLTLPESRALYAALGVYADAVDDDPGAAQRTRAQKMADCLLDLVLRRDECTLPPVQVALTVVAPMATALGGDQPGEIDGHPVPAELIRQVLQALTDREPAGAPGTAAREAPEPEPDIDPADLAWLELQQREFSSWSEEMQRRILAGEVDDPDPWTPEEFQAWVASLDAEVHCDHSSAGERVPAPQASVAGVPGTGGPPAAGVGWWSDADRAVEAASSAVCAAELELARAGDLVRTAAAADAMVEETWRASPAGRVSAAEDAMTALAAATASARDKLLALLTDTGGGGLVERPRIALTDALTGALLALTDLPGLRRAGHCGRPPCRRRPEACSHDLTGRPGLGPPPPTDGYRPGAELDRFVRARDRRCRFPGCRRPVPRTGELDHDRRYPDGPTAAGNLTGYCTANHRGKHQAPGWHHCLADDGTLTVTTPTGLITTTDPPPY